MNEWAHQKVDITMDSLRIRRARPDEFAAIAAALHDPDGIYARVFDASSPEKIIGILASTLESSLAGICNPFVYTVDGEIAGISRFFRFDSRRKSLEIGGTWIARKWQQTFVNTWVKYLLLKEAFGSFGAERVEFMVNDRNYRSQMAVLRLGARHEGVLRGCYPGDDRYGTDGFLYSIIGKEWPEVEARLQRLIAREPVSTGPFSYPWQSGRCELRPYKLVDAGVLLNSFLRNRSTIADSFPGAAKVRTLLDAEAYIAEKTHLQAQGKALFMGVWLRRDPTQLIGQLQAKNFDWRTRSAELGYYIDSEWRLQGLGREILETAIEVLSAQHGIERLQVRIISGNQASAALASRVGFVTEGVLCSAFMTGADEIVDVVVMSRCLGERSVLRPPSGGQNISQSI